MDVDDSLEAWPFGWRHSPASKHRRKSSVRQYPCDFLSLITLNFNPPFLHRSTNATRLLHFLRELLFLWQTNAHDSWEGSGLTRFRHFCVSFSDIRRGLSF